jgi:hypothetical protein
VDVVKIRYHWIQGAARICCLLILLAIAIGGLNHVNAANRTGNAAAAITLADFQSMIFVWASGTPEIQSMATDICRQQRLDAAHCAQISAAVRAAWLDLMNRDPASVGRPGVAAQPAARQQVLATLGQHLRKITSNGVVPLLSSTRSTAQTLRDPNWVRQAHRVYSRPIPLPLRQGATLVWATSFLEQAQNGLPAGMDPYNSRYVAVPDQYVKYANIGQSNLIPDMYQSFYTLIAGQQWSVNITSPDGGRSATRVPVTDVGPWNEDDNWWDANGVSAQLPSGCPVATSTIAKDATSNILVNGICPNGQNTRRLYYYLLYKHGTPFFHSTLYSPTGTFVDGTRWPSLLPIGCAETVVASINDRGMACGGGPSSYNANNGSWLREDMYDNPILNQASIDLSPAMDTALGWTYPSSGLVEVDVSGLP